MKYFILAALQAVVQLAVAQVYTLKSPDTRLEARITTGARTAFTLVYDGKVVAEQVSISMQLGNSINLGKGVALKSARTETRSEIREVDVPHKDKVLEYTYNELILVFKKRFEIQFRAFNDGVAYRFVSAMEGKAKMQVMAEQLDITFPPGTASFFPEEKSLYSHYEQLFEFLPLAQIDSGKFCALPVRFDTPDNVGLLITESDLFDYPGLFLQKSGSSSFGSLFPKYVLETEPLASRPDRYEIITHEADYIAQVSANRSFPWRIFMVSADDRTFVESNLVTQLSRASLIEDVSWIKPGKVAWDWYNANNLYGVDFRAGINNDTYKYYIDFAAQFGLEYVILDEGWTKTTTTVTESIAEIDVPDLVSYAESKGVGVILWLLWHPLDSDMEPILKLYSDWGVKGIKVDFMQRADQYMVNSYERIAMLAATYHLLVDFHGAFKPTALSSAYPNVMTYEGVKGNENNKWSQYITPEHNVTLPFTRMVAGPMDYTPGAMANAHLRDHHISFYRPMSLGTRSHQAAMYVVFESPLQMLCDAPTAYLRDTSATRFISGIPTIWDETRVLHGKIADYIVVARRKGNSWYVGAMTDWTARTLELDLSFLADGVFTMQVMSDGVNADIHAEDYRIQTIQVSNTTKVPIQMAPGGGWAAILTMQ